MPAVSQYNKNTFGMMKRATDPLQSTFYSSARVVFVDRFGIRWGIMTETAEHKEQDEKELADEIND